MITDVPNSAVSFAVARGLNSIGTYLWDLNDRTRAFDRRVRPKTPNDRPDMLHAGRYSGTMHHLKAAADMGVAAAKADGDATIARVEAMPTSDDCFGEGRMRPDGRELHPGDPYEVKTPSESKESWNHDRPLGRV